jgi:hypothetical protein
MDQPIQSGWKRPSIDWVSNLINTPLHYIRGPYWWNEGNPIHLQSRFNSQSVGG